MNKNVVFSLFGDKLRHNLDEIKLREKKEYHDPKRCMYICKKCGKPTVKFIMNHNSKPVFARIRCDCDSINEVFGYDKPNNNIIHEKISFSQLPNKNSSFNNALITCQKFCKNIDRCLILGKGIFIQGSEYSGKTSLIDCIATELENKNINFYCINFKELINLIKKDFGKIKFEKSDSFKKLSNYDVLLIDDISVIDGIYFEQLFENILTERFKNKKPTIFTSSSNISNLKLNENIKNIILKMSKEISTK